MNIKQIYRLLSSMKIGLIILVIIGIISAVGSALSPETFYHSSYFKLFLIMLLLNLTLCTINQLTKFIQNRSRFRKNQVCPIKHIGMLMLHAGVIFILIGGTVYAFQGENQKLKIEQGQTVNITQVIKKADPFSLKLKDFKIEFNPDATPSQYYSDLSVIENGNVTKQVVISVNNPLEYQGIKAYQSSFGYLVDIQGESPSGWKEQRALGEKEHLEIQGTDKAVLIYKYIPNYDPQYGMESKSLRPDNPRIIYSIHQQGSLLTVGVASFGEKVELEPRATVTFNGVKPFTILTVKRDPGLSLALAGGLMLMFGTCLTLCFKPKKQGDVQ